MLVFLFKVTPNKSWQVMPGDSLTAVGLYSVAGTDVHARLNKKERGMKDIK